MIWHIFKKDWKLLRWQAVAVVALATGSTLADAQRGYFGGTDPTRAEAALIILSVLAGLFLITELVQQDPIPGGAQDWLVRPVKRADLLLAKLLFILLALEAPMLIIVVVKDCARGFPLGATLSAVTLEMLSMTVSLGLPALALASLFRGVTETIRRPPAGFVKAQTKQGGTRQSRLVPECRLHQPHTHPVGGLPEHHDGAVRGMAGKQRGRLYQAAAGAGRHRHGRRMGFYLRLQQPAHGGPGRKRPRRPGRIRYAAARFRS